MSSLRFFFVIFVYVYWAVYGVLFGLLDLQKSCWQSLQRPGSGWPESSPSIRMWMLICSRAPFVYWAAFWVLTIWPKTPCSWRKLWVRRTCWWKGWSLQNFSLSCYYVLVILSHDSFFRKILATDWCLPSTLPQKSPIRMWILGRGRLILHSGLQTVP